ncbi:tryptophan halogenase family protein [Aquabacterium sp. OR-4]|uniref:tryptophan halogenase family protein n=1 Tax=Aquabacterium sp. OR-4 TaxID=2978127 RepID=UPI0028CAAD16|nr:tryptophan halogenase family protein [Aquabacterium sp. OR-4]MDT7839005.1 tryptophan halogenase family protein [Aquabacterium sp. OR-4]
MSPDTPAAASTQPVRRIVIAGGGTAGWMVAACISKTLGQLLDIRLIESDEIGTVGVGEATIPTLHTFHELLGIHEQEFMAATQATFKLGIRFEGWRDVGEDYIHSFGLTGQDHWTAGFQHFWLKGRARGLAADYGAYCLELRAAEESRFAHLPRNGLNYAYHLDATLYARFLRQMSQAHGVQRIEGKIVEVRQAPPTHPGEPGDIQALRLDNGALIEGDLFIDCTGMRSLLLGQTLGVAYQDWSHWLPCDSAVAVQTASVAPAVPYTRSIAHTFGWQWRIPLQHRVGNGLVYASRDLPDDQAGAALLQRVQGEVLTQPRVIKFTPGQREVVWRRNCVAIGLASGFLEPLESTSIHLIQRGVLKLMQLFPQHGIRQTDIDEYNRQCRDEMQHIRDFIILHYHVTHRDDVAFWRHCRTMDVPDSLRHRIALFRETARVFRVPNELFAENSWIQVMLGQGIVPQQHHPVADLMGDAELDGFLREIRGRVERSLGQLPEHAAYVARYSGTPQRGPVSPAH